MSKKLRIGFLLTHPIQYLSPWFVELTKLAEIVVFYAHRQSSKGQADAGFGVEFDWDISLLEGYKYYWLKNIAKEPSLDSFFGCDTPEIKQYIRGGQFDAFVVLGWNKKSCIQAIMACKFAQVPVLIRGDSQLGGSRTIWKKMIKYPIYRLLLPNAGSYLSPGSRNRQYLRHFGVKEEHIFNVPHFVDNERFRLEKDTFINSKVFDAFKQDSGLIEADFIMLFVGKLIPKKRPMDFLEACIKLSQNHGVSLKVVGIFVGDGPLAPELKQTANDAKANILFMGFQNQSQLHKWYAVANVIVLPSDADETWGLVLNEALACGIPVVASNAVGAAPDLVLEGVTGFSYQCGNVQELVKALNNSMSLDKNSTEIRNGIRKISDTFSMESATNSLFQAIQSKRARS